MMEWNISADLMDSIRASIKPVGAGLSLRQVLAQDFPEDCANLPISGGWGYSLPEAIRFVRSDFDDGMPVNFVPLEYRVAHKIIREELVVSRTRYSQFSGIDMTLSTQLQSVSDGRQYDR